MKELDKSQVNSFIKKFGISKTTVAAHLQVSKQVLSHYLKPESRDNRYYNQDLITYFQKMKAELDQLLKDE